MVFKKGGDLDPKMPQMFASQDRGTALPKKKPRLTVGGATRAQMSERRSVRDTRSPVRLEAENRPFMTTLSPSRAGSEEDTEDSASVADMYDFATDSEEEVASEHEDEEIKWVPPKNWDAECRRNQKLKEFGDAVWKIPSDRASIPVVHEQPLR